VGNAAEGRTRFLLTLENELAHLIDGADARQIAFSIRVAPGEEAVATEQDAIATGIFLNGFFEEQG